MAMKLGRWIRTGSIATIARATLSAQCGPIRHITGNFSYDIVGEPDNRPYVWGRAGSQIAEPVEFFNVPAGMRVRILSVKGDMTARWTTRGNGRAWPGAGYYTGVLGALMTSADDYEVSEHATFSADNHLVYVQADIGLTGVVRVEIESTFHPENENAVLPHGKLWFKAAKYLDETGLDTHIELTFSRIEYCYEAAP